MATRIRCTMVSSTPCSLREASSCMEAFSTSDFLPSDGVMLSYISTVAKALRDGVAMQRQMDKGELTLPLAEELPARVNGVKAGMVARGNGGRKMGQEAAAQVEAVKELQTEEDGQASGEREQKKKKRKRRESVEKELVDGGQEEKKLEWDKVGTSRVVEDGEVPAAVVKDRRKKRRKERAGDGGGA